jgi:hypothetical protein
MAWAFFMPIVVSQPLCYTEVMSETKATPDWILEAQARAGESLDPELVPYLEESKSFGQMLRSPLVYDIPHWPAMAYRCNDQLRYKKQALAEASLKGDWHSYVWLHERPWRAYAMWVIARRIKSNDDYWELLGQLWCDTENLHTASHGSLTRMIETKRGRRHMLMEPEERAELAGMADEIRIYRGYSAPGGKRRGWAWTTDSHRATWFAERNARIHRASEPVVVSALVKKADVIAYFTRRSESEIVVNPKHVYGVKNHG